MASYVKFDSAIEHMLEEVNLGSDTLNIGLTNTQPTAATNDDWTDITEITQQNGYSGPQAVTTTSSSQTGGTYKLVLVDEVFTASGGSFGPLRYAVMYDDTVTTPVADPLLGYWDYGSSVTVNDTETFTVDFDPTNGVIQAS